MYMCTRYTHWTIYIERIHFFYVLKRPRRFLLMDIQTHRFDDVGR